MEDMEDARTAARATAAETAAVHGARDIGTRARHGRIYWAVFTRSPGFPIVHGSHWGARVNCPMDCNGSHGHLWTSEDDARARLEVIPQNYAGADGTPGAGAPIGWQLGRVLYVGSSSFYDVVATSATELRQGDTVNMAGAAHMAPQWQRVGSIEAAGRVGGREGSGHGADVVRVWWYGAEESAAPSLLSSRELYDVVRFKEPAGS